MVTAKTANINPLRTFLHLQYCGLLSQLSQSLTVPEVTVMRWQIKGSNLKPDHKLIYSEISYQLGGKLVSLPVRVVASTCPSVL